MQDQPQGPHEPLLHHSIARQQLDNPPFIVANHILILIKPKNIVTLRLSFGNLDPCLKQVLLQFKILRLSFW